MDIEKKLQEAQDLNRYYENVIEQMAAPIIPSIVPKTILVPIAGMIFRDRFDAIRTKVLEYADTHKLTETVIFDFTGVGVEDVAVFDYNELANEVYQLNAAVKLMGLRSIYVGFNPRFVQEIVNAGIQIELEAYVNFRTALKQMLNEKDKSLLQF